MEKSIEKNKRVVRMQRLRWGRIIVQLLFFIAAPALFSQAFGGVKEILTAIGGVETIKWSTFTAKLVALCVITVLFGRIFCGWMCAFGALGDWLYQFVDWVHKKSGRKRKIGLPQKYIPVLQKLKYVILVAILLCCFFGKNALITKYSPWTVFSLLTVRNFNFGGYVVAAVLLIWILFGMMIQERFFCQFLCPMGAVFSLLPEVPFLKLKRREADCIPNCQLCKKQCPVEMKIEQEPVREGECIRCGRCMATCPKENISISAKKKTETPD